MDSMNEKILIEAKLKDYSKTIKIFRIVAIFSTIADLVCIFAGLCFIEGSGGLLDLLPFLTPVFSFIAASSWIFSFAYTPEKLPKLVITNKRVYGQFNQKVPFDFPISKISAIVIIPTLTGRAIVLSSGGSKVAQINDVINAEEVKEILSKLIAENTLPKDVQKVEVVNEIRIAKEEDHPEPAPAKQEFLSGADEIKKYKELLDQGIITQEEFDAKKKQLLGI